MIVEGDIENVASLYNEAEVLVTGATGFLAGVLLEKLLYENVKKIFVLVRERGGKSPEERMQKVLSSPLFQKHEFATLSKVVPVRGDLTLPHLGLDSTSRDLLANVSIVFHAAASINFNASLHSAITINLIGSYRVLEVCKSLKELKCLVYTSTAYCNVNAPLEQMEEKIYPSEYNYRYIIDFVSKNSQEEVDNATKRLLGVHPNTYTFSKQLAENMFANECGDLRVAIVRPSIVLGTWSDPVSGWVDNVHNGALATVAGCMKGIFRYANLPADLRCDFMPVDLVTNLVLTSAWDVANSKNGTVRVFHLSSTNTNPITWGEYADLVSKYIHHMPSEKVLWFPGLQLRKCYIRFMICYFLCHVLLAAIHDFVLLMFNRKPILINIQKKYLKGSNHVSFFTYREWNFDLKNSLTLKEKIPFVEKHKYNFDVSKIDWSEFMKNTVFGLRLFYFREQLNTIQKSQNNLKRLKLIHNISYLIGFALIFFIFYLIKFNFIYSISFASMLIFLLWWV